MRGVTSCLEGVSKERKDSVFETRHSKGMEMKNVYFCRFIFVSFCCSHRGSYFDILLSMQASISIFPFLSDISSRFPLFYQ
jgi:hypothetical protein